MRVRYQRGKEPTTFQNETRLMAVRGKRQERFVNDVVACSARCRTDWAAARPRLAGSKSASERVGSELGQTLVFPCCDTRLQDTYLETSDGCNQDGAREDRDIPGRDTDATGFRRVAWRRPGVGTRGMGLRSASPKRDSGSLSFRGGARAVRRAVSEPYWGDLSLLDAAGGRRASPARGGLG